MLDVIRFWLDLGLDGFRCDAVPYLFEREGTNCENLPETHAFLKGVRAELDDEYPGRLLLAEANQWPTDVRPLLRRRRRVPHGLPLPADAAPVHGPAPRGPHPDRRDHEPAPPTIPDDCQWGIFLRNHDELTLEMVTDEERDYMYAEYAKDPRMRINLGIRRRLAPLMDNGRRQIELLNGLLFSLPGSPVLYYGDEIGMGDNIYLGDRDGVRTPMQWTGDRNAGFSRPTRPPCTTPFIIDPVYGYQAVNVEAQERVSTSLLHWVRRMIQCASSTRCSGSATTSSCTPTTGRCWPSSASWGPDVVLVVNNLSRFAQPVELDLSRFHGLVPEEMFGRTPFPVIDDEPYRLGLGPHGFYWFHLVEPPTETEDTAMFRAIRTRP